MSTLHAVPNPEPKSESRELVKTVALTTAVSTFVGILVVAGGNALWQTGKRMLGKRGKGIGAPIYPPSMAAAAAAAPTRDEYEEDSYPEALRMQPNLRHGTRRRKRSGGAPSAESELKRLFAEFEARQDARFQSVEQRLDDALEEDEVDEEDED